MSTIRDIALRRTPKNRKAAMKRQRQRRRECERYGAPATSLVTYVEDAARHLELAAIARIKRDHDRIRAAR